MHTALPISEAVVKLQQKARAFNLDLHLIQMRDTGVTSAASLYCPEEPLRIILTIDAMGYYTLLVYIPNDTPADGMLNDTDLHLHLHQPPHAFNYGLDAVFAYLISEPS
ncbi:MAG TPA: hypothetical protein VFQ26_08135 [Nitrospiraceae bacterium]|nr:hypothetical protein [Nitrospiraceae bacterium]